MILKNATRAPHITPTNYMVATNPWPINFKKDTHIEIMSWMMGFSYV